MTRMTGPDCVVMCNLINTHTHTHTHTHKYIYSYTHTPEGGGGADVSNNKNSGMIPWQLRPEGMMYRARVAEASCPKRSRCGGCASCPINALPPSTRTVRRSSCRTSKNLDNTTMKRVMVRFRGAREKGAMTLVECLGLSHEDTMEGSPCGERP